MSFQYTDKQLNQLNWDKNVYSVNTDFAIRKDFEIITHRENLSLGETNSIVIDEQEFRVVATKTDKVTGFEGMAVARFLLEEIVFNRYIRRSV